MALKKWTGVELTGVEYNANLDWLNESLVSTGNPLFDKGGGGREYGNWTTPLTGDITIDVTGQVNGGYIQGVWTGTTFNVLGVSGTLVENVTSAPTSSGTYKFAIAFLGGKYEVYFPSVSGTGADTTIPVLTSAIVSDGAASTLVLTYNEALDATSTPVVGDFVVNDGAVNTVTAVVVSSTTVTLTLTNAIDNGDTVVVSYTAGTNPIQDTAGNYAANLTTQAVTNNVAAAFLFQDDFVGATINLTKWTNGSQADCPIAQSDSLTLTPSGATTGTNYESDLTGVNTFVVPSLLVMTFDILHTDQNASSNWEIGISKSADSTITTDRTIIGNSGTAGNVTIVHAYTGQTIAAAGKPLDISTLKSVKFILDMTGGTKPMKLYGWNGSAWVQGGTDLNIPVGADSTGESWYPLIANTDLTGTTVPLGIDNFVITDADFATLRP